MSASQKNIKQKMVAARFKKKSLPRAPTRESTTKRPAFVVVGTTRVAIQHPPFMSSTPTRPSVVQPWRHFWEQSEREDPHERPRLFGRYVGIFCVHIFFLFFSSMMHF